MYFAVHIYLNAAYYLIFMLCDALGEIHILEYGHMDQPVQNMFSVIAL